MKLDKNILLPTILVLALVFLTSCASHQRQTEDSPLKGMYLSDLKSASVDIVYERGRNSHRFFLVNEPVSPQVFVFHDRQLFKSLKINQEKFRELLTKSLDAADSLQKKPAKKLDTPCRTPFMMTLKNTQETHTVEGCRAAEEGAVIGRLIAEIEYMISSDAKP